MNGKDGCGGHIPGAQNIPWARAVQENGAFDGSWTEWGNLVDAPIER